MRKHFVLVPGFAGFNLLGGIKYYQGVLEVLRADGAAVHFFPNLPTAGVATRAEALGVWVAKRFERGVFHPDDELHLVGHSTGGLDIRQLVWDLKMCWQALAGCSNQPNAGMILGAIKSVRFLSAPQRGANIARWLFRLRPLPRALVAAATATTDVAGPIGTGLSGRLGELAMCDAWRGGLWEAVVEALTRTWSHGDSFGRARARRSYYQLLHWLAQMRGDWAAMNDLCPPGYGLPVRRRLRDPVIRTDHSEEESWYGPQAIRCQCFVTVARPTGDCLNLFDLCHKLCATCPPDSLGPEKIIGGQLLRRGDSDGLANSVSMVWPPAAEQHLVRCDHGDIIGHYGGERGGYDLLRCGEPFARPDFVQVWEEVREFT